MNRPRPINRRHARCVEVEDDPLRDMSTTKWLTNDGSFLNNDSSTNSNVDVESRLQQQVSQFQTNGFLMFPKAIDESFVATLRDSLESVLLGTYDRGGVSPDKVPMYNSSLSLLTCDKNQVRSQRPCRVLQIINIHKSNSHFHQLATSPEIGRLVAQLTGWQEGVRLAQDQVWAKPPGSSSLVFHRDSPYFMFTPTDVVTVWVALDDMDQELGPLEYVQGSHKWGGNTRVGSSSAFFDTDSDGGKKSLYCAAKSEGIPNPQETLSIVSTAGLPAGSITIHDGKTWHGSGRNQSKDRPRRGLGLHYVPAQVRFTKEARCSKLWRKFLPESDEELRQVELLEKDFPVVWRGPP